MQPPSEPSLNHNLSPKTFTYSQPQPIPCTGIDALLCDLITHLETYSDDDFDANWMHLTNAEVEELVIALMRHLITTMNGKLLSGYLLEIRQEASHVTEGKQSPIENASDLG